jgi:hypothetical protein
LERLAQGVIFHTMKNTTAAPARPTSRFMVAPSTSLAAVQGDLMFGFLSRTPP